MVGENQALGALMRSLLLSTVLACVVVGAAHAQTQPAASPATFIHVGRLIAEPGTAPTTAKTLIVRDGKIEAIRDGYVAPAAGAKLVDLKAKTVLPGLIDSHVHLLSELSPNSRLNEVTKEESDLTLDGLVNA